MNGVNRIFVRLTSADTTFNLPTPINVGNSVIALTEIGGTICPRIKCVDLYLCCDIVKWSLAEIGKCAATELNYFPIISRINHRKTKTLGKATTTVRSIDMPKPFFVECDRERIESLNLYMINEKGERVSFESCTLSCTLTLKER